MITSALAEKRDVCGGNDKIAARSAGEREYKYVAHRDS